MLNPASSRRDFCAFTLTELLVTIAIVGVLVSLLFPAIKSMIAISNNSKCASNLRALGQIAMLYVAEHDNNMPPVRAEPVGLWYDHLHEYVGRPAGRNGRFEGADHWRSPWRCPALKPQPRDGYAINWACGWSDSAAAPPYVKMGNRRLGGQASELPGPLSQTAWFADTLYYSDYFRPSSYKDKNQFLDWRHNKAANVLFMDGHVESVKNPGFTEDADLIKRDQWVKFFGGYQ